MTAFGRQPTWQRKKTPRGLNPQTQQTDVRDNHDSARAANFVAMRHTVDSAMQQLPKLHSIPVAQARNQVIEQAVALVEPIQLGIAARVGLRDARSCSQRRPSRHRAAQTREAAGGGAA